LQRKNEKYGEPSKQFLKPRRIPDGIRLSTYSLMLRPLALLAEERETLLSSLFIHGFKLFASSSSTCASLSDQALI